MKNNIYLKIWRTWKLWRYEMQQSINFYPSRRSPSCKTASHRGKSRFGRWAMSKSSFFWTKISITFCKQYSRIEFCPDLRNSHSGMWRLLASSLVSTLGNSLRKCGSEAQRGQTLLVSGCIWRWVTHFKSLILLSRPHLWIFSGCSANSLQASFPRRLVPWLCHLCRGEPGNCHFFP